MAALMSRKSIAKKKETEDFSFIYGKWMRNSTEEDQKHTLNNFTDKIKSANNEDVKTIIKANAVEEIVSVQIDKKQLEDAVLQHQFEKVETAEEFGGNWRDMDGDDDDLNGVAEELQHMMIMNQGIILADDIAGFRAFYVWLKAVRSLVSGHFNQFKHGHKNTEHDLFGELASLEDAFDTVE